jgi:hypothetical protein
VDAICRECGRITSVAFVEAELADKGVRETSFSCEHCQTKYPCFYTDDEIRWMINTKAQLSVESERTEWQEMINKKMKKLRQLYS